MKADIEKKNGFTEANILGAIGGAIFGGAIGFAAGAVLPSLVGGALIGASLCQWIADTLRNKRKK